MNNFNIIYVQHDVCNCFTAKVSVSNFKVEKSENGLRFFDLTLHTDVVDV